MTDFLQTIQLWQYLLVINIVTFAVYGIDKRAAKLGNSRIPEKRLHLLAILGGTPAAFLAQRHFRHKTRKDNFQTTFWFILFIQAGLALWWVFG